MAKSGNWERARDWITRNIESEALADGDRLPTEGDIQRLTGVGRHSVRRAVAMLAAEGVLSVEQGRGTFVRAKPPILYRIGARTRFRENLMSQGVTPSGDAIAAGIVPASAEVAQALGLAPGAQVHRVLRRNRADGRPISLARAFHDAARFPDLGARRQQGISVTDIYRDYGIPEYHRLETSFYARLPDGWEARELEQSAEQPVIVMCKTDIDEARRPIGFSESIWSAGRVRFSLEPDHD
ncbi:phosphonate metabolism transcriptional regulator PhnF [Salipiger sp. P9]|uniref:phosphonate metabolism transcriptional regulator PhnF n=1 Tax=Salipiger pentaromativorans TaxID=2943193 RepID=UPI0021578554|nr:phosphonate metabolism transcriptional regulator PhnF [Salipiger pentaromativorans]MCR8546936.1 phosphonate metabolism transcriptional regulator PhnF [Salipiger pentaromativorans]